MYLQYSTRNEIVNAGGGGGERPSNCLLVTLENLDVRNLSSPMHQRPAGLAVAMTLACMAQALRLLRHVPLCIPPCKLTMVVCRTCSRLW